MVVQGWKSFAVAALCVSESVLAAHPPGAIELLGEPTKVAVGIVSSEFSEIRATASPDGRLLLWGSTNRPGGPGGWNIWLSRRTANGWSAPEAAPFNSEANDFDPAFSPDGRWVYFFSNRPGGFGGDDIYRVVVTQTGFGAVEHLGAEVNSAGDEWAPGLSPNGTLLLFSSDDRAGQGRHDLFVARAKGISWSDATPLPGAVNTSAEEFDATFLSDGTSIVFARSANLETDRITLTFAARGASGYTFGTPVPFTTTLRGVDALGPTIDWHDRSILLFSAAATNSNNKRPDIYKVRYRLR